MQGVNHCNKYNMYCFQGLQTKLTDAFPVSFCCKVLQETPVSFVSCLLCLGSYLYRNAQLIEFIDHVLW